MTRLTITLIPETSLVAFKVTNYIVRVTNLVWLEFVGTQAKGIFINHRGLKKYPKGRSRIARALEQITSNKQIYDRLPTMAQNMRELSTKYTFSV